MLCVFLITIEKVAERDSWTSKLEFSWRLGYTLISTTMMEATRPMYIKLGQLPPGLELLGGDGRFPPSFYQFNESFQRAVEELWEVEKEGGIWVYRILMLSKRANHLLGLKLQRFTTILSLLPQTWVDK